MIQRLVWLGVLFLIAGLWMTGCTNTQRLTVSPLEPPPGYEKMPLRMYFPDFPQSLWEDQETEVIIEWTLSDGTGRVLWAHTAGGVKRVAAGTFLNRAKLNRNALQQAVDAVFRTFRDRLVSAPELRTLAISPR
jgi:hypothetical protein